MIKRMISLGLVFSFLLVLVPLASAAPPELKPAARLAAVTDPSALIAEVNVLRVANGLPPYTINSTLMAVAQAHSVYMATTGNVTHFGADGSRPFQRALTAGYPVGGDLSLGGFFSENITAGPDLSVSAAVSQWQGDAPHLNTMLSENLTEVGAGVSIIDGYVYYVLDASQPAGTYPSYTPPAGGPTPGPIAVPVIPVTPNADGSITHTVKAGEALWTIAAVYNKTVDEILELNGLKNSYIYPGDVLIVQVAFTPTPLVPSPFPSKTPFAFFTSTDTSPTDEIVATSFPTQSLEVMHNGVGDSSFLLIVGIVIGALLVAGIIALVSSRRESLR